jgi:ribosomal protein S12 methylthiotransferase accessory factor
VSHSFARHPAARSNPTNAEVPDRFATGGTRYHPRHGGTMSSEMTVSFPGGKRVSAHYDGFDIATDQGVDSGGGGTAPEPFDLFLASLATCAGYYVLKFCESRGIPTDGIALRQSWERNEGKKLERIVIRILVPPDFPEKYRKALVRAADQCSVKKTIQDPPKIMTETVVSS